MGDQLLEVRNVVDEIAVRPQGVLPLPLAPRLPGHVVGQVERFPQADAHSVQVGAQFNLQVALKQAVGLGGVAADQDDQRTRNHQAGQVDPALQRIRQQLAPAEFQTAPESTPTGSVF
ncbi:hypothetical protein [Hydrogenophaga sp.]|uniref:hypothetical protein n=1 Tax=Hydrogenophaga sp. TaxID=1904254 RepID=UPI002736B9E3|nr:hypothetical protein [Hydrogenophaga sp.]